MSIGLGLVVQDKWFLDSCPRLGEKEKTKLVNSFPLFSSCTPKAIQRGNGHNEPLATFLWVPFKMHQGA
jgi:hypothetical protein